MLVSVAADALDYRAAPPELPRYEIRNLVWRVGDYLEAGNVIGYLEIPTKYYSLEGCNLYFEMLKDGQPVNPMDYLAEE